MNVVEIIPRSAFAGLWRSRAVFCEAANGFLFDHAGLLESIRGVDVVELGIQAAAEECEAIMRKTVAENGVEDESGLPDGWPDEFESRSRIAIARAVVKLAKA